MNMPQDFRTELARLERLMVVTGLVDLTAWTLAVWWFARSEWLGGTIASAVTAVATNAAIAIFRKAQSTIEHAEHAVYH